MDKSGAEHYEQAHDNKDVHVFEVETTEYPSNLDPEGTDALFKWDYDVVTNLAAMYTCFFASTLALIAPTSALGFIEKAYPSEASIGIWIAASVTVCDCVLQAFIGDLSDQLGRKPFLVGAMVVGCVGQLISRRASSLTMVIGGQVLSGAGLTCGYLSIPLTAEIVPKAHRPTTQALSAFFSGLASATASIISGAFIKHDVGGVVEGWRCGFYIGACLYAIVFACLVFFYHPSPRPNPEGAPLMKRVLKIDWFGVFLVAAGLTIFLVSFQFRSLTSLCGGDN